VRTLASFLGEALWWLLTEFVDLLRDDYREDRAREQAAEATRRAQVEQLQRREAEAVQRSTAARAAARQAEAEGAAIRPEAPAEDAREMARRALEFDTMMEES